MRSVSYTYGKKGAIIKAYIAKNDIICCKYSPNFIESIINKVSKKVDKNIIDIKDIDSSIIRISNMKNKFKFNDNTNFDNIDIDKYNKTMEELNNKVK